MEIRFKIYERRGRDLFVETDPCQGDELRRCDLFVKRKSTSLSGSAEVPAPLSGVWSAGEIFLIVSGKLIAEMDQIFIVIRYLIAALSD